MEKVICCLCVIFFLGACDNNSNIVVFDNYNDGLLNASEHNQKILLIFDFWGNPTNSVNNNIYNKKFEDELRDLTIILLKVDEPGSAGIINRGLQKDKFGTDTQPTYYLLNSEAKVIKGPIGYCKKSEFEAFIRQGVMGIAD